MQNLKFVSKYDLGNKELHVNLVCFSWKQDNIFFIFAPAFDITGYGNSFSEASDSFKISLEEFIDYTHKKNTFFDELEDLGWLVNRKKKRFMAPDDQDNNETITELLSEGVKIERSELEMQF